MVTNYRGIDAPRSAERGVLMTSRLPAGNVQVEGEDRFVRGVYVYICVCVCNLRCFVYSSMDDSKFESCERQDALTCLYK